MRKAGAVRCVSVEEVRVVVLGIRGGGHVEMVMMGEEGGEWMALLAALPLVSFRVLWLL